MHNTRGAKVHEGVGFTIQPSPSSESVPKQLVLEDFLDSYIRTCIHIHIIVVANILLPHTHYRHATVASTESFLTYTVVTNTVTMVTASQLNYTQQQ